MRHDYGRDFERRIAFYAQRAGLLCVHHGSRVVRTSGGNLVAVKSDLDFRLSDRTGRTVYFDAKSFDGPHLALSQLPSHQCDKAIHYSLFRLVAGFLIELRQRRQVVFLSAETLKTLKPRQRLRDDWGTFVGAGDALDLARLCQTRWPATEHDGPRDRTPTSSCQS